MQASLIIPSSKTVAIEMQNEFGQIPPVLIPMMGKIAFRRVVDTYHGFTLKTYVGIQENADAVEEYFQFFPDNSLTLVRLESTESISDTLEQVMARNPETLRGPSIINFADTVITDLNADMIGRDFICYSNTFETERWTLFRSEEGKITDISDKEFRMESEGWMTFIGVWGISDTRRFYDILHGQNEIDKKEAFYESVRDYYNQSENATLIESRDWMDYGHVDNYYLARKRLMNTRFFNRVSFSSSGSSLVKTSSDVDKLSNEINWYLSVPSDIRYYTPNIINYSLDPRTPFLEMEYYSYPSLDDCFVYARFDFDTWNKIFGKLFDIIRIASKHCEIDDSIHKYLWRMYVDKTLSRFNDYVRESGNYLVKRMTWESADGTRRFKMTDIAGWLPELLEEFNVFDVPRLQIIHGDFCFSNILYDCRHGITKLIDPRGSFGRVTVLGDVYYDLAKLSHSVSGLYDFIMFDEYRMIAREDDVPSITWHSSDYHDVIGRIFNKHLVAGGYDFRRTRFIEALLFISMLPLHRDNPKRQEAMLLRGFKILSTLVE